jgi:transcriptional regulator with XRE-family HTH domain
MAKKAAATPRGRGGVSKNDLEVGRRIKLVRIERDVSQQELGKLLGVTFQQVQKYEKGANRVASGRLMEIASALKTTPHELMGWNSNGDTVAIDVETYRLAKSFMGLKETFKAPIRHLIFSLMKED